MNYFWNNISHIIKHPVKTASWSRTLLTMDKNIASIVGVDTCTVKGFKREIYRNQALISIINDLRMGGKFYFGESTKQEYESIYAIVRAVKPELMVETGVASGASSSFILQAMMENGFGKLVSIELPNPTVNLENGKPVGFRVPEHLRQNWGLVLEDVKNVLPKIVNSVRSVDVFLHDSEHSYENMMFEFNTVWHHIRHGGILLADDTLMTESEGALFEFAAKVGRNPVNIVMDLAAVLK